MTQDEEEFVDSLEGPRNEKNNTLHKNYHYLVEGRKVGEGVLLCI